MVINNIRQFMEKTLFVKLGRFLDIIAVLNNKTSFISMRLLLRYSKGDKLDHISFSIR